MIGARTLVHPDFRRCANRRHHHIQPAIAIEVADGGTAMPTGRLDGQAGFGREGVEPEPALQYAQVAENGVRLRHRDPWSGLERLHMSPSDEDVFPPVIIEIENGDRKSTRLNSSH